MQIGMQKLKVKYKKNENKKKISSKITFTALNENKKQHLKQKKIE